MVVEFLVLGFGEVFQGVNEDEKVVNNVFPMRHIVLGQYILVINNIIVILSDSFTVNLVVENLLIAKEMGNEVYCL